MKYHHGGIQSPISTQSTPPPQFGPPPPQFCPQCPCPGPGIHGMSGPCGLASATPAPSPRAVKPTTPVVAATTTILLRFILHPWCNYLPLRCSSSPIRITRGSPPAARKSRTHCQRVGQTAARIARIRCRNRIQRPINQAQHQSDCRLIGGLLPKHRSQTTHPSDGHALSQGD